MLEMDDKKLCQTKAIMNYVGASFNLLPSDLLLRHKGEKIVAFWMGDIIEPNVFKIPYCKLED